MEKCKKRQWRKLVKKLQRKAKRQKLALNRSNQGSDLPDDEQQSIAERKAHDKAEKEWLKREQLAQEEFQRKAKIALEKQKKSLAKAEKRKAEHKHLLEIWTSRLKEVETQLDNYCLFENSSVAQTFCEDFETRPTKTECEFYKRTGCCRFDDACGRNHKKPILSRVLLFRNLFGHFAIEKVRDNEHGSDNFLEFDEFELYQDYCEFFDDIYLEISKFAKIAHLKTCRNRTKHLSGNVYVEFESCKEALQVYRRFSGRFYSGKRISIEFVRINNWKSAICASFLRKSCIRLNTCNYLHVFKNPYNLFNHYESNVMRNQRWSESP